MLLTRHPQYSPGMSLLYETRRVRKTPPSYISYVHGDVRFVNRDMKVGLESNVPSEYVYESIIPTLVASTKGTLIEEKTEIVR